jgi:dTDP-4-dehydrorhamnose reductase
MQATKTILITGAHGQLASELYILTTSYPDYNFKFITREELSIEDSEAVKKYFNTHSIQYCINCAAYTAVDKAEIELEKAFAINAYAAGNLALTCAAFNTPLIHISTDYVFDGAGTQPYKETDATNPLGVYGQSKLKGEELVLNNSPSALILRTSWLYSSFGNNFVKTMLRLMKERDSINVVNDQYGCPTYAADLAVCIMEIIKKYSIFNSSLPVDKVQYPIFNYCNEGIISWYDFAVAIKELTQSNCIINSIPTIQYPTPAKRPQYSVLDTALIKKTFELQIPHWKESLKKCLRCL